MLLVFMVPYMAYGTAAAADQSALDPSSFCLWEAGRDFTLRPTRAHARQLDLDSQLPSVYAALLSVSGAFDFDFLRGTVRIDEVRTR